MYWRGVITVAGVLRDDGMGIVCIGNAFPPEIIETTIQEGVDVVGVSTLSRNYLVESF